MWRKGRKPPRVTIHDNSHAIVAPPLKKRGGGRGPTAGAQKRGVAAALAQRRLAEEEPAAEDFHDAEEEWEDDDQVPDGEPRSTWAKRQGTMQDTWGAHTGPMRAMIIEETPSNLQQHDEGRVASLQQLQTRINNAGPNSVIHICPAPRGALCPVVK